MTIKEIRNLLPHHTWVWIETLNSDNLASAPKEKLTHFYDTFPIKTLFPTTHYIEGCPYKDGMMVGITLQISYKINSNTPPEQDEPYQTILP